MGVYIKGVEMPKGCIYEDEKGKTEYCLLLNHNDIPYCTYIEDGILEPEVAIGIDERPCYCPLVEVLEPHGDLIDKEVIKRDLSDFYSGIVTARRLIDAQDVVIEAEVAEGAEEC